MFSIFARTFGTATRHDPYDPPSAMTARSRPLTTWERERIEAERRHAAMRNVGLR